MKYTVIFLYATVCLTLFSGQVTGWGSLLSGGSENSENNNDIPVDNIDTPVDNIDTPVDNTDIPVKPKITDPEPPPPPPPPPQINKQPITRKNAVSEDVEHNNNKEEQPLALTIVEQDQANDNEIVTAPATNIDVATPTSAEQQQLNSNEPPIFEPEEDWKEILPGQHIPGGLDVRMNLQTGKKYARLMSETASSHWSNKRNKNVQQKEEHEGEQEEILVADHTPALATTRNNKTSSDKHRRLDINNVDEDDENLSPLDAEMKSAQMIERVLTGLPLPPKELQNANKLSPEKYKEVMQLLWKKRQLELKDAEKKIHNSAKAMQSGTDVLLNMSSHDDDKLQVLENMEYEVQQLDNAMDFATIGGLAATINLLDHQNYKIRKYAAWVVGTAVKNYNKVQQEFLKLGGIDTFIHVIQLEGNGLVIANAKKQSIDVIGKQLYGLGASLRGSLSNSNYFFERNGSKLLYHLLSIIKETVTTNAPGNGTALSAETMVLERKMCGIQNKVVALIGDTLHFAIERISHFGGVELLDGTNGVAIAKALTTLEWCKLMDDISESACDDDVSREKILRTLQIMLQIAKRNGAVRMDKSETSGNNENTPSSSNGKDDLSKCLDLIDQSSKLKKSLNIWKAEWSNALLEDPTDEYARELIGMVDNVLGVEKSED